MPKLILLLDASSTKQVVLKVPEMTVGRAPINDLCIDHERVSRFHAVLHTEGPFTTIKDLNSRNGLYINGIKVQEQNLVDGDEISLGDCRIRFLATEHEFTSIEALRLMTIPGLLVNLDALAPPARAHGSK